LDVQSKVMIALQIGPRNQKTAHAVIHEVTQRLVEDNIPIFSQYLRQNEGLKKISVV